MTRIEQISCVAQAAFEGVIWDKDTTKESFDEEKAERWLERIAESLPEHREEFNNAHHSGDCIKQCCTCLSCYYSDMIDWGQKVSIALACRYYDPEFKELDRTLSKEWYDADNVILNETLASMKQWILKKLLY